MLTWWRSAPRAKLTLSLVMAGGVILVGALALAIPLYPRAPSGQQDQANAYAARDEQGEYAHWHSLGVDGSATPSPTSTVPARSPTATATRGATPTVPAVAHTTSLRDAFATTATQYGVPAPLLEAFCYMEGRMSNHGGSPSIDNGFGCMHLVHNDGADTLDQAATDTGMTVSQLRYDIAANILGGAAVLRDEALRLSPTHTLPAALADWYGAVEAYSGASTPGTARMYADGLYQVLNTGFSAEAETGEIVTLAPQGVQPNAAALPYQPHATSTTPTCTPPQGSSVDYPGAVNCILDPAKYDCEIVSPGTSTVPCNYDQANRPSDYAIDFVVIHDIEGTAADAISTFQTASNAVSCHYVIDSNGIVYQVLNDQNIAWHAGNYWYNQHSIGIEHAGIDATGYEWYNALEYLASAKLVAWLSQHYGIPLDHNHIVAHGTVPSPTVYTMPNHVDPGPYWLWDYYFNLINQQGVPFPAPQHAQNMVVLYPPSATNPVSGGTSTAPTFENQSANFSFFYLYTGPSTKSGRIVQANPSDITDETNSVEPGMSFYYVTKTKDQAGTGDTMYEIWYGEADELPNQFQDAKLAWLAVPPGAGVDSQSTVLTAPWAPGGAIVQVAQPGSASVTIYGKPLSGSACTDTNKNPVPCVIGSAPTYAVFASAFTVTQDGNPSKVWYEINYNHRQAWVPASEVTVLYAPPGGIQSLPTPTVQPR